MISQPVRLALIAVRNGAVKLDAYGGRDYPDEVNGRALTAAYDHGLWRWPASAAWVREGDVAELTPAGVEALQ
jgi:hypothetical protein